EEMGGEPHAVTCCADLDIPFFVHNGNKKLVFWFVRKDGCGHPEIARCTEREFASLSAHITAGAYTALNVAPFITLTKTAMPDAAPLRRHFSAGKPLA
ncbi:hypothetical protein CB021_002145, partial [Salmonella enterica]|nr:hypothetical protein [Salmonella enterica]